MRVKLHRSKTTGVVDLNRSTATAVIVSSTRDDDQPDRTPTVRSQQAALQQAHQIVPTIATRGSPQYPLQPPRDNSDLSTTKIVPTIETAEDQVLLLRWTQSATSLRSIRRPKQPIETKEVSQPSETKEVSHLNLFPLPEER